MYHLFRENILLCENIRHHCIERPIRSLEEHKGREEKRRKREEKFEISGTMDANSLEMMSKYDDLNNGFLTSWMHIWNFICCLMVTLNVPYRFLKVLAPKITNYVGHTELQIWNFWKSKSYSFLDFVRNSKMMI